MLKLSPKLKTFFSKLRLVYFGTGEFAVKPLEMLCAAGARPTAVVTSPDNTAGRGNEPAPSPVKVFAIEKGLRVLQPEKLDAVFIREFKNLKPTIALLSDYGKLIPKSLLDIPVYGFINIHPSLLPKYRGASPIESAILEGEVETGVTLIAMDELLDHGPILGRRKAKIKSSDTGSKLRERLSILGAELLLHLLPRYIGGAVQAVAQNEEHATFTRQLSREDGKLLFAESAERLLRKIRAFAPWPGTWAVWKADGEEKRLKVIRADAVKISPELAPEGDVPYGTVLVKNNALCIATADGLLNVYALQLEGKKTITAKEFLNGYPQIVGSILV